MAAITSGQRAGLTKTDLVTLWLAADGRPGLALFEEKGTVVWEGP